MFWADVGCRGGDSNERSNRDPVNVGCCGGALVAGVGAAEGSWLDCCTGFLEGLTSHASSSNPRVSFFGGGGTVSNGVGTASGLGFAFSSPFSLCLNLLASTTSLLCTVGAGRPLRVLFLSAPPGPEKRPPPSPSGACPPSSYVRLAATERNVEDQTEDIPVRPNLESKYFITRSISPSLRPSVRNTDGLISPRTFSSIESLLKLKAYLSH